MKSASAAVISKTHRFALFETAIGTCGIAWSPLGISAIKLPERTESATKKCLLDRFEDGAEESAPTGPARIAIRELTRHLSGESHDFSKIELDLSGVPPFHRKVYVAARQVPPGQTVSYGDLARAAGSPAAARAVGQAMARNPFAIVVPCHRIMGHDGSSVGFSSFGGCSIKERLLSIEGFEVKASVASRRERKFLPADKQKTAGQEAGVPFRPGRASKGLLFDAEAALAHISKSDKKMARLIEQVGPYRLELDEMLTPFETLAESIVYQQLTGKAAATIFARVKAIYGGSRLPAAKVVLSTPDEQLRAAGLSSAKTLALKDLAAKQHAGLIPNIEELQALPDQQIIERLTAVRGIGRWTVEMLLMFRLGRPDVLPIHDYGVRKGFALVINKSKDALPTPKELEAYGERWRPFRSVASWYLWRALEL